ncbi:MAG: RidA family protein [Longimicrobiales bacterium]
MKSPFFVLLTMSLVAAPALTEAQETPPLPEKTVILPRGYRPSSAPLSPAILVGNTLYLSGNTGGDPETGRLVDGGLEPEFHQIMANMRAVLAEAGMDLSDVVSVVAYLADMDDYRRFNELYREYFKTEPLPVRATVAVRELARRAHLELQATAVRTR